MKFEDVALIFPHQLFEKSPVVKKGRLHLLVEHPRYFTDFNFHQYKLVLHRASMKAYAQYLKKKKLAVEYLELKDAKKLFSIAKKASSGNIFMIDPVDHNLMDEMQKCAKRHKFNLEVIDSPMFLSPTKWLDDQFKNKKTVRMHHFYGRQRKRMNILMRGGKPVGGVLSFDDQNREPLDSKVKIPTLKKSRTNAFVKESQKYVKKNFSKNPGQTDGFFYPVTHTAAKSWLDSFVKDRLKDFGPYQDAMADGESFLFHSVLTPMLNTGLLTPEFVVERVLAAAKKRKIPLNSLEGFIRQVIGWREFVYGTYRAFGKKQKKSNALSHKKKLPKSFWSAKTSIVPVDDVIDRVLKNAYAHHIERLMVLGNIMMLMRVSPHEVYNWFMELFIDAYDWVMVPNVYGMSQYADGGIMTTKPYCSSSNYIEKMSNYKKGEWCEVWDALFWTFLAFHKKKLIKIPRMRFMMNALKKKSAKELARCKKIAIEFCKKR